MGFFDNGNYFLSHPGELFDRITGGSGSPEVRQVDPLEQALTVQQGGGAAQNDPEKDKKVRQFLVDHAGLSEPDADAVLALEPKTREQTLKSIILSRAPKIGKSAAAKPPKEKINREVLKKEFPDHASEIDAVPEQSLANIVTMLYKQKLSPKAPKQIKPEKPGLYRVDRSQLPAGMQKFAPMMTDEAISGIARKEYEKSQAGDQGQDQGGYWPRLKGHSLKIYQDDAFKRSGLKSGDTVCIKIP